MSYCSDCGTKKSDGVCPNCSEELFIYETQYEWMNKPISDDFMKKVVKQSTREYK